MKKHMLHSRLAARAQNLSVDWRNYKTLSGLARHLERVCPERFRAFLDQHQIEFLPGRFYNLNVKAESEVFHKKLRKKLING